MALSNKQKELLQTIQSRLQRGDVSAIGEKCGMHKSQVSRTLNPLTDFFNEVVVDAAMKIILEREAKAEKNLDKLTA